MANRSPAAVLKQMATLFQVGTAAGRTDGGLLDRFRSGPVGEAEAAFAVLVERHGAMVMQVCRRILGDRHDAEDAAQATFLVLARQARSIRHIDSLASWLYGVAVRVATRAHRDAARRRLRELHSAEVAMASRRTADEDPDLSDSEMTRTLHEELGRLPERFRLPIMLCHLEGLTYEQAAFQLGCPVRTVHSRLARARRRLRDRLTRRGMSPAVVPLARVLNRDAAAAAVSERWKHVTVQAALRYAASGSPAAVVSVSATVAALAEGASRAMILHRLIPRVAFLLFVGVAAGGTGLAMLAPAPTAETPQPAPAGAPPDIHSYRVTMAGNATIEVIAVSTVPTGPDTWWKPDGTRLAEPPADTITSKINVHEDEVARVVLVRASGMKKDDMFRWLPTPHLSYWGGRPRRNGEDVPGLEYYAATFPRDQAECTIKARVAAGAWKTETSDKGGGGVGRFVNGHKFTFGKARPYTAYGREMTVFAVAHNFLEQDRRIVAVDHDGKEHPAFHYSVGSDGDQKWMLDLIDAEFALPPDQIQEFLVQFRPIEQAEIKGIVLKSRPADR